MRMFKNQEGDFVVAESAEDALTAYCDSIGESADDYRGLELFQFSPVDDDYFLCGATAAHWARKLGRGYWFSTNE